MDNGMRKPVPKLGKQQESGTFFSSDAFESKVHVDVPIQMCMILDHRVKTKVYRNEESVDPRI